MTDAMKNKEYTKRFIEKKRKAGFKIKQFWIHESLLDYYTNEITARNKEIRARQTLKLPITKLV